MNKWKALCFWVVGVVSFLTGFLPEIISKFSVFQRLIIFAVSIIIFIIPFIHSFVTQKVKLFWARRKRIKIGIAIEDYSQSQEIVDYSNKELDNLGLSGRIKFEVYKLKNNNYKKISNIVANSNTDVVVFTTKNQNSRGKISINFTYKNTIDNLIAKIIHAEFSSLVSKERAFSLSKEHLSLELDLEKNNIAHFSLFIVAICTSLFRGCDDGIFVFEGLLKRLDKGNGVLKRAVMDRLSGNYLTRGGDLVKRKRYSESLVDLERANVLKTNNVEILALLAFSRFFNGNEKGAEDLCEDLLRNHTGNPTAHIDGAFFRIRRKNYKSALTHYLLFAKSQHDKAMCLDVIGFMADRLDEDPKELGYLFAIGFLKRLLNENSAKMTDAGKTNYVQDFEVFIQRASGNSLYKEMVEVASKYVLKAK